METQRNKWKSKVVAMCFIIIAILPLGWQTFVKELKPNPVVVAIVVYWMLLAALDFFWWSTCVVRSYGKGMRKYHLYSALRSIAIAYTFWSISLLMNLRHGRPIDRVLGSIGVLCFVLVITFSHWLCQQTLKEEGIYKD